MSDENDLPGVVFHKKSSELIGTNTKGIKRVRVILEATVRDDAVWKVAEEKLDGLKVYTVDDFKGEMLNALREDYMRMEKERDRLLSELAVVNEENKQMKAGLSILHRQIDG